MVNFRPDPNNVNIPTGSRYRKVEPGFMPYPYKCAGCGSSERACLDLDFERTDPRIARDRIGSVLLCVQCYANTADVMGYVSEDVARNRTAQAVVNLYLDDAQRIADLLMSEGRKVIAQLKDRANEYSAIIDNIVTGHFDFGDLPEVAVDMESSEGSKQEQHSATTVVEYVNNGTDGVDGQTSDESAEGGGISTPEEHDGSNVESAGSEGSDEFSAVAVRDTESDADGDNPFGL